MDQHQLDKIIQQYLESRNHHPPSRPSQSLSEFLDAKQQGNEWVLHYYLERETERRNLGTEYTLGFKSFNKFVDNSQHLYQLELAPLLFPVFVYFYLDLIRNDLNGDAKRFFSACSQEFQKSHRRELDELLKLESPQHLAESQIAKTYLDSQHTVRMSQPTYELLMTHLCDKQEFRVRVIINKHLRIRVFSQEPHVTAQNIKSEQPPKSTDEYLLDPALRSDIKKMLSKTSQKRKRDEDLDSKNASELLSIQNEERINWEIVKKREETDQIMSDVDTISQNIQHGKIIGPSVCFFSFLNSDDDLHCIRVVPQKDPSIRTGPSIFAGFSDSTIKCWNWDKTSSPPNKNLDDELDEEEHGITFSTLVGHSGPVYGLSVSNDHQWLLSSSEDSTIRLWNRSTATNIVAYKGHQYPVWDVKFSPIDYLFASASHDRTAKLWCTDRVTPLRIYAGHSSDVETIQFHPNCNYLASGSSDKTVRLWDVNVGEQVRLLIGHKDSIRSLAFSPNGRLLASGCADGGVIVWDISTSRKLFHFENAHTEAVWNVSFNSSGTTLASSSLDHSLRVWNMVSGSSLSDEQSGEKPNPLVSTYYTKNTPIYFMDYLPDRDILLASGPFSPHQ